MQQEIAFLQGRLDVLRPLDDGQLLKSSPQDFFDPVGDAAGPQTHLRFGQVLLQQPQHARRVGDVADVDRLPGRAKHDSRRAAPSTANRGGRRYSQSRLEKLASIHKNLW